VIGKIELTKNFVKLNWEKKINTNQKGKILKFTQKKRI